MNTRWDGSQASPVTSNCGLVAVRNQPTVRRTMVGSSLKCSPGPEAADLRMNLPLRLLRKHRWTSTATAR